MHLELPALVRAVKAGDDLVLLDAVADRYLCLPATASLIKVQRRGRLLEGEDSVLGELRFEPRPLLNEVLRPAPDLPTSSLPEAEAPAIASGDAARLLQAYGDYLIRFRGRSFASILANARDVRRRAAPDPRGAGELARIFAHLAVWLPVSGQCLVRSYLLLRFLLRCGHDAQWVFGVRTWPFRAHCWLQAGEVALDDHADRLVGYTPIASV